MIGIESQVNKRLKMPWQVQDKAIEGLPDRCLNLWPNGRFRRTFFYELEAHTSRMYLGALGAIHREFEVTRER